MKHTTLKYVLTCAICAGVIGFLALAQRQYEDRKRIDALEMKVDSLIINQ